METLEATTGPRKRSVHATCCVIYLDPNYSDVTDVAWSPEDRFLASVGLDSAVMVWCGFTLGMVMHRSYLSIDN